MLNGKTGKQIFNWLSGMVKDGLAATNPADGSSAFDNLWESATATTPWRSTPARRSDDFDLLASGAYPNVELGVAPMPGLVTGKGGALRERRVALHHEQVVAREAGGRLAVREVPQRPEPGGGQWVPATS